MLRRKLFFAFVSLAERKYPPSTLVGLECGLGCSVHRGGAGLRNVPLCGDEEEKEYHDSGGIGCPLDV